MQLNVWFLLPTLFILLLLFIFSVYLPFNTLYKQITYYYICMAVLIYYSIIQD